jgi:hypothetical protein
VRPLYTSFGVKGLTKSVFAFYPTDSIYWFRMVLTTGSQYITEQHYVVGLREEDALYLLRRRNCIVLNMD